MKQEDNERMYIESKLDVTVTREKNAVSYIFQRAKLKLVDKLEINMLTSIHPHLNKQINLAEDQLTITFELPSDYHYFDDIFKKNIRERYRFAYNVIDTIESHTYSRLHLTVSPENILFDQGLQPTFLHYGVSESIPPYEKDDETEWLETRALLAYIVDHRHDFRTYMNHYKTIDLKGVAKEIMFAENFSELKEIMSREIKQDVTTEKTIVHLPKKKWTLFRSALSVLIVLFLPALAYSFYILFFKMPEMEAYVSSNEHFLNNDYSSVVDELQQVSEEKMPRVVQYELAMSYIANESLTEEQKKNILNTVTLQSDRNYYLYWIYLGRGNYEEAVDIATYLEDRDLILLALIRLQESVRIDESLSSDERKEMIKNIEREMEEYKKQMEDELSEEEEVEETEEQEDGYEEIDEKEESTKADEKDKKRKKESKKE
ncbi:MAG TPA: type VII secretion protein EssB [Pseudogracilibacillus sp.]|nr:type VII secretion protein EssB [Pseudogracilibacillus sp.]